MQCTIEYKRAEHADQGGRRDLGNSDEYPVGTTDGCHDDSDPTLSFAPSLTSDVEEAYATLHGMQRVIPFLATHFEVERSGSDRSVSCGAKHSGPAGDLLKVKYFDDAHASDEIHHWDGLEGQRQAAESIGFGSKQPVGRALKKGRQRLLYPLATGYTNCP